MSSTDILLTCASWEDRFRLGLEADLQKYQPRKLIAYYYDQFADWSADNRSELASMCRQRGVEYVEQQLHVDGPAANWKLLQNDVTRHVPKDSQVDVDITTVPRELIWTLFWSMDRAGARIRYTYHSPREYNSDWLSRDPGRPRLVYKLSGLAKLGQRTVLVAVTGYDSQRTSQLIRFFEPEHTLVGLQAGDACKGNAARMAEQRKQFENDPTITLFDVDAFAADHGESVIMEKIRPYVGSSNIIMSSLGPKLSAVAIYRIHRSTPEAGICYAPSSEFNREYSRGLANSFSAFL